jgi:indoleamine 2,3-dioxygenase
MPVLSINNLKGCERELRRAHLVLTFMVQFYTHTVPSREPIIVPQSLTVPLLQVSRELQHAPYITYSDHALHNWSHREPREEGALPTSDNLQTQTTFTGTPDENEFHMTDIRIELKGAEAVEFMRLATDEIVRSDNPDVRRIARYLKGAAAFIEQMKDVLMSTKKLVKPEVFYYEISPWLMGADVDPYNRKWVWEGSEEVEGSEMLTNISGPTAAQSPLVPTLDAYLGLVEDESKSAFLDRVRIYMIHNHEAFLQHLRSNGRPIRSFVQRICREQGADSPVVAAYDAAINAMKEFRDAHLIIVTLYVILPARKAKASAGNPGMGVTMSAEPSGTEDGPVGNMQDDRSANGVPGKGSRLTGKEAAKGSQGSQLMEFLKGFRDQTNHGRVG